MLATLVSTLDPMRYFTLYCIVLNSYCRLIFCLRSVYFSDVFFCNPFLGLGRGMKSYFPEITHYFLKITLNLKASICFLKEIKRPFHNHLDIQFLSKNLKSVVSPRNIFCSSVRLHVQKCFIKLQIKISYLFGRYHSINSNYSQPINKPSAGVIPADT